MKFEKVKLYLKMFALMFGLSLSSGCVPSVKAKSSVVNQDQNLIQETPTDIYDCLDECSPDYELTDYFRGDISDFEEVHQEEASCDTIIPYTQLDEVLDYLVEKIEDNSREY